MNEHQAIEMFTKDWFTYTTICIIAGSLLMILCRQLNEKGKYYLRTWLGITTLASAILIHPYLFSIHEWTVQNSLPLHMCELSEIFAGIVLIWQRQRMFEILCYWGIPGGLNSILTPELLNKGENGLLLFQYYYEHSIIIIAPVLLMVLYGMRLPARSWLRAFVFTNLCIPVIGTLNWLFGSNYMYLAEKPLADNPFLLGDWPWYLLVLEFVALVHFYLVYIISTKKIRIPKALFNTKQSRVYNILRNLPVSFTRIPLLLMVIVVDILSMPFQLIEKMIYGTKIKKEEIDPNPVFIIGHWRSGTTFLHQLLSNDPQFGYINFYSAMFPNSFLWTEKIMKPVMNKLSRGLRWKIPFFNNIRYDFDFPCEEDTALLNMGSSNSAYWAYALPKKAMAMFSRTMYFDQQDAKTEKAFMNDYLYLLKKISLKYRGKRLLLKSPPNTVRIQLLLEAFPGAKFIYLDRRPVDMYYSHSKLWKQCLKQYGLQKINQTELDHVIIQTMKNMLLRYNKDKSLLNNRNLYEVSYEKFINDPLSTIKEIYQSLEIPGFCNAQIFMREQINKSKKYTPFSHQYNAEKTRWVEEKITA